MRIIYPISLYKALVQYFYIIATQDTKCLGRLTVRSPSIYSKKLKGLTNATHVAKKPEGY